MNREFPGTIEEKMRLVANLDERIGRTKTSERQALVRGFFVGAAMFTILGAWPHDMDPVAFGLLRYGGAALLVGSEFLVRRLGRRRLEAKQEKLLDRPAWGKAGQAG
jgi:hypothetical protein